MGARPLRRVISRRSKIRSEGLLPGNSKGSPVTVDVGPVYDEDEVES
jgi:hypothetical protein